MMKYYILGLCCFLAPFIGQAQSISWSGKLLDAETEESITGVSVFLAPAGGYQETDPRGEFQFDDLAPGAYVYTIYGEGYQQINDTIRIEKNQETTFRLAPLLIEMATVEVDAKGGVQQYSWRKLRNVEGVAIYAAKKTEVIETDYLIANTATNNAREVYKSIPGLNIWESDGGGLQLNIGARGLDPNRTSNFNTRQNGYDISADALGYPESYYTPPVAALQRIEVVRGAASLQYGTQFGGLLNFVFKEGAEDHPIEYTAENTVGAYGLLSTFHSLGGTKGSVSYYSFYQYKQSDGWRENSGFDQHTAYGQIQWKPNAKLSLRGEYTYMHYLAQQAGGLVDFEFLQDAQQSKRDRNWFMVDWNLAALQLDYAFSPKTRINIRNFALFAGRKSLGELAPINRPDPLRERDLIVGEYRNLGSEGRFIHQYDWRDKIHTLLTGYRVYRGNTQNQQGDGTDGFGPEFRFLNPNDLEQSDYRFPSFNAAFFAEHLWQLTDRWTFTPGVRAEYIRTNAEGYYKERVFSGGQVAFEQRFDESLSNERGFFLVGLGTAYRLGQDIEIYANFSQNYRSINFSDLAVINPNLRIDENLSDERGNNADLGIRGTLNQGLIRFDITAFALHYNNRIGLAEVEVEDQILPVAFRTNIGNAKVLGLESFIEADLFQLVTKENKDLSISLFTNFSLLHGRYLSGGPAIKGNRIELIPDFSLKTGTSMRWKGWGASFLFSYVGEQFSDATNAVQVADATRGIIPSYWVADCSVQYEWKWLQLRGGLNNLTDEQYFTRRAAAYPGPGIIPSDGRTWYLSFGWTIH